MTERIEPYIITRQDNRTGQREIYAGDPRYANHKIPFPVIRRTATLAEIETINFRSQTDN
jgi:hypothetical protein